MNVEIPDFLLEMSKQMSTQDCRMTSHPLYQVKYLEYLPTAAELSSTHSVIINDDNHEEVYDTRNPSEQFENYLKYTFSNWCKNLVEETGSDTVDEAVHEYCENTTEFYELPDQLRQVYMQSIEKIASVHFTEVAAREFIKTHQHNYPPLFVYVDSAYRNAEIIQLQNWIKSLIELTSTKYFYIDGYYQDTKNEFTNYLVKSTADLENDDEVFFYGLDEDSIKHAIELGEKSVLEFVITAYRKIIK